MQADWYYVDDDDETVGPTSLDELIGWIRRTGQSTMVWTEGMVDWVNSNEIAFLRHHVQHATHLASSPAVDQVEARDPTHSKRAKVLSGLQKEFIEYAIISGYLFICFSSVLFYKAAILRGDGVAFAPFGIAAIKALILGKFVLILQALRMGANKDGASILLINILKKSLLFAISLVVLTVAEELIVGYFHSRTNQQVLSEIAGGTLSQAFASSILVLLILIPYFTFQEVAIQLGDGVLWRLLTTRVSSALR